MEKIFIKKQEHFLSNIRSNNTFSHCKQSKNTEWKYKEEKVNKVLLRKATVPGPPLGYWEIKPFQLALRKGVIFVPQASHWVTIYEQWHMLLCPKLNIALYSLLSSWVFNSPPPNLSLESKQLMRTAKSLAAREEIALMFVSAPALKWVWKQFKTKQTQRKSIQSLLYIKLHKCSVISGSALLQI